MPIPPGFLERTRATNRPTPTPWLPGRGPRTAGGAERRSAGDGAFPRADDPRRVGRAARSLPAALGRARVRVVGGGGSGRRSVHRLGGARPSAIRGTLHPLRGGRLAIGRRLLEPRVRNRR